MTSCPNCEPREDENICFVRGSTYQHQYQYVDGVTNLPIDLTGYDAKMQFREKPDSATFALELTIGAGITLDELNGIIDVIITAAQTATLTLDRYHYDLMLTAPSGEVDYPIGGLALPEKATTK